MKKLSFFSILLALAVMTFSLSSCDTNEVTKDDDTEQTDEKEKDKDGNEEEQKGHETDGGQTEEELKQVTGGIVYRG